MAHDGQQNAIPTPARLLITADGGREQWQSGAVSGRSHCSPWRRDGLSLPIHVCHFPPGTSKWNKIEHRMFSLVTQNWRGRPLVSHEAIVNLIANTTTRAGLKIRRRT